MVTGVAGCRMVTVCPGTPGAIWLATVWMTRLAAGMVANAMVGFSSKPAGRACVRTRRGCPFSCMPWQDGRYWGKRVVVLRH